MKTPIKLCSDIIGKKGMYLPNHQDLTESQILYIRSIINKIAKPCQR